MTCLRPRTSFFAVAVLSIVVSTDGSELGTKTQEEQRSRLSVIEVNRRRPLAEVVLALEQRHGIPITYEDPPYRHSTQRINDSIPSRPASFVPRGGPFSFKYMHPVESSAAAMKPVLGALLRQYHPTGYAGNFELQQTREMFHIVPVSHRSEKGVEVPYDAILSTDFSFVVTGTDKSALDVLTALTQQLQAVTGVRVVLGTIPTNLLNGTEVPQWSATASARSHLIRILASTGERLSWRLLYDPNEPGMFVLNIHML